MRFDTANIADNPVPLLLVLSVWVICMILLSVMPDEQENRPLLGRKQWFLTYVWFEILQKVQFDRNSLQIANQILANP